MTLEDIRNAYPSTKPLPIDQTWVDDFNIFLVEITRKMLEEVKIQDESDEEYVDSDEAMYEY